MQIYRGCLNPPPRYLYAVITNSWRATQFWDKQPAVVQLTWNGVDRWTGTLVGDLSYASPFTVDYAVRVDYLGGLGTINGNCTKPPIRVVISSPPFGTASDIPVCQTGCCEPLTWTKVWYTGAESYHMKIFSTFELAEAQRLEWQKITGCLVGRGGAVSSIACSPASTCPTSIDQLICTFASSNCACWNGVTVAVDWLQHEIPDTTGFPSVPIGLSTPRTGWYGRTNIGCSGSQIDGDTNYFVTGICFPTQGWRWTLQKVTSNSPGVFCVFNSTNVPGPGNPFPGGTCGNGTFTMIGQTQQGARNGACCNAAEPTNPPFGVQITGSMTAIVP